MDDRTTSEDLKACNQKSLSPAATLAEVAVWEDFRSLSTEGTPIHASLLRYMLEQNMFDASGDTLEIGAGDGHLWRIGGELFMASALEAGALYLTDADSQILDTCRATRLLQRKKVIVELADVENLLYPSQQFARVIAIHVLHWCQTDDQVRRAIGQIARVLKSTGRAIIVTVDERIHMTEIYQLMERSRTEITERGILCDQEIPPFSPRVKSFCAGNATELLQERFEQVERIDCAYAHLVESHVPAITNISGEHFFLSYLRSLPFIKEAVVQCRLPQEFFEKCARLFRSHLAVHGTFRMSRCDVIYDCSKPRAPNNEKNFDFRTSMECTF